MADGTRVYEPPVGANEAVIDTIEVDFGGGDVRDRQRVALAGVGPTDDIATAVAAPATNARGLVVRPAGDVATDSSLQDLLTTLTSVLTRLNTTLDTRIKQGGSLLSSTNRLPVDVGDLTVQNLNVAFPDSIVSTLNSTSTPLVAGASFDGAWEECTKFSAVSVLVETDQYSAINGARVEYSDDGVTARRTVSTTIPPGVGLSFVLAPEGKFFRLRYTNGTVDQTLFVGQTMLHYQTPATPQSPLGGSGTDLDSAGVTAAHLKARKATGAWDAVLLTASAALAVDGSAVVQPVALKALSSWTTGHASVASDTVPVKVIPSPSAGRKTFCVKALSTNSLPVSVGPTSAVTISDGFELAAGDSVVVEVDETSEVWVVGQNSMSQGVCWAEVV